MLNHTEWRPPSGKAPGPKHSFPKIVHLCWFPQLADVPPRWRDTPTKWRNLNPGWAVMTWSERQFTDFMQTHYPMWLGEFLRVNVPVKKSDFARMVLLHHYGGVYIDFDIEPLRSLDSFLSDEVVWARLRTGAGKFPRFLTAEEVAYGKYEIIFSREYQRIDEHTGVANGVMIARDGCEILREFIEKHFRNHTLPVLKYMGPHALTYFLRKHYNRREHCILPPYYWLWERDHFKDQEPPSFCVATHGAQNSWGDHSKPKWWDV